MIKKLKPMEIENKSFEIISEELGDVVLDELEAPIIKRVIHTSADFDYAKNLVFSKDVVKIAHDALNEGGLTIVSDTNMVKAGINKNHLAKFNSSVECFIQDEDIALAAKENETTRSAMSMQKASKLEKPVIFAIGNAPTALIEIERLVKEENFKPVMIIAVPVGFVNVVESKELIEQLDVPYIIAKGRKGGSNVAAAIVNALMYETIKR
ncbi:MAG: precorrin-8X methylmutase [Erysipelotrichales bacterium]